jgi:hypothetical protein
MAVYRVDALNLNFQFVTILFLIKCFHHYIILPMNSFRVSIETYIDSQIATETVFRRREACSDILPVNGGTCRCTQ